MTFSYRSIQIIYPNYEINSGPNYRGRTTLTKKTGESIPDHKGASKIIFCRPVYQDKQYFSATSNCYGYAVKCANPINSTNERQAKPNGVVSQSDVQQYYHDLKNGVLLDGGDSVQYISGYAVSNLSTENIPSVDKSENYLVAMLVKPSGFLFLLSKPRPRF